MGFPWVTGIIRAYGHHRLHSGPQTPLDILFGLLVTLSLKQLMGLHRIRALPFHSRHLSPFDHGVCPIHTAWSPSVVHILYAIIVLMAGEHDDAISRVDDLIDAVRFNSICCVVQARV